MNSLIIGLGEIGKGLYLATKDYHPTQTYDITYAKQTGDKCDVLNICIPGGIDDFVVTVGKYIQQYDPSVTIIHSTVPVGTTKAIADMTESLVVHSPVRGVHWKSMSEGVNTYVKYVGSDSRLARRLASKFLRDAGITVTQFNKSETTELGKILSTTDYGINLLFAELKDRICSTYGLNYSEVVGDFTKTYNEGIAATGERFRKQELDPPGDKIGGHCVVENAYMLLNQLPKLDGGWDKLGKLLTMLIEVGKGDRELSGF